MNTTFNTKQLGNLHPPHVLSWMLHEDICSVISLRIRYILYRHLGGLRLTDQACQHFPTPLWRENLIPIFATRMYRLLVVST